MTSSGQHFSYFLRTEDARKKYHWVYTQFGKGCCPSAPPEEDNQQLLYTGRIWRLPFSFLFSDQ
jgi:hypothetical protein